MLEAIVYMPSAFSRHFAASNAEWDLFGTFLLALVTTPLLVLPVLLITGPSRRVDASPNAEQTGSRLGLGERMPR